MEKIYEKHSHEVPIRDFEKWQKESNITYGEIYQSQYALWMNDTKTGILGIVNIDNCSQFKQNSPFHIHPSIIDTFFQQLGFLARADREMLMPWFIKRIRFSSIFRGPLLAQTRLESADKNVRGSSRLINLQGEVLLELEGIILRGITPIIKETTKSFKCFRVSWEQKSPPNELLFTSSNDSTNIIELKDIAVQDLSKKLKEMGENLINMSRSGKNKICVVGRQSQQVFPNEHPDPVQAALWAWYLVAKKEFGRININLIDIDKLDSRFVYGTTGHIGYACRKGNYYQPVMLPVQEIDQECFPLKNCLITGGLGSLGIIAASVLVELV